MKPLEQVTWGFALVFIDINLGSLDVVPDLLGWAIIAIGLQRVRRRSSWFDLALFGCAAGLVESLAHLLNPPDGWLVGTLAMISATALVFGVCSGILETIADAEIQAKANTIRWFDLVITGVAVLLLLGGEQHDVTGSPGVAVVLLALAGLGVAIWFAVFCYGCRDRCDAEPAHR